MLRSLQKLYSTDKQARVRLYILSFSLAYVYALFNDLVLKRAVPRVLFETILVCIGSIISLPMIYAYRIKRLESPAEETIRKWSEWFEQYPPTAKADRWLTEKDLKAMIERAERILQFAELTDSKEKKMLAFRILGNAYYVMSLAPDVKNKRFADAIHYHDQSLVIARELEDKLNEAHALFNISLCWRQLPGGAEDAAKDAQSALAIYEKLGRDEAKLVLVQLLEWGVPAIVSKPQGKGASSTHG